MNKEIFLPDTYLYCYKVVLQLTEKGNVWDTFSEILSDNVECASAYEGGMYEAKNVFHFHSLDFIYIRNIAGETRTHIVKNS